MKSSKRSFIIIGIILASLTVVLAIVGIILYLKTDILKTDEELFQRQFLQNIDEINQLLDISLETQYRKTLEQNSFNEDSVLGLKYIDTEGKEDNFTGSITAINNKEANMSYKDIKINLGTTNVMNLTYLKENNIYGIRFLEGTKFATIDLENDIIPVLKYFGIEDIISSGKINIVNLSDIINLSDGEIKEIESQYISIILQSITKKNYSSEKEKTITLNNNTSVVTNSYVLSLNAQQLSTIYENILDQLSQDEIIIAKLEDIDKKIKEFGINLNKDIKTYYLETISQKIKDVNIQSSLKVTVYEKGSNTVRTTIEYENKTIQIDINNTNDITIKYSNNNEKNTIISIKKENNIVQASYEDNNNTYIEFTRQLNINNNEIKSDAKLKYKNNNDIKDLEFNLDRRINIGEPSEIPTSFEQSGKVLLNDYDEEATTKNLKDLKNRIMKLLRDKRDETNSSILNYIIEYNNLLEENEKTDEENKRKKFNSKFELYEGKNQEQNIVSNLLDEVGKNISNYQSIGNNKVKIYIQEGNKKPDLINEIKNILFTEEQKNYNIYLGYDNNAKINEIDIEVIINEEGQ